MLTKGVHEIVLTGGPCAGKTSSLAYLSEKLAERGYRVFITPEIPTMFILGGVSDIVQLLEQKPKTHYEVEKQMILTQHLLRKQYNEMAKVFEGEKRLIIYDRAEMDAKAYMGEEPYHAALEELNLTLFDVRDSYDGVIHLVTAAKGAKDAYTRMNNQARYESIDEAIFADDRTMHAWVGHSHLRIVDNSTTFDMKLHKVMQSVCRILGIPAPLEIERKFLLKRVPSFKEPELKNAQKIDLEQMYLTTTDGSQARIRKRSQNGQSTYYRTKKFPSDTSSRVEIESIIKASQYLDMQSERDLNSKVIRKQRWCFVYKHQYFELDVFESPAGLALLEIELTEENDQVMLPPFLEIDREVTGEEAYTNAYLASHS